MHCIAVIDERSFPVRVITKIDFPLPLSPSHRGREDSVPSPLMGEGKGEGEKVKYEG